MQAKHNLPYNPFARNGVQLEEAFSEAFLPKDDNFLRVKLTCQVSGTITGDILTAGTVSRVIDIAPDGRLVVDFNSRKSDFKIPYNSDAIQILEAQR